MAESVYGFDKKGFDRVDKVVQAVEGVMQPRGRRGRRPPRGSGGFKLTRAKATTDINPAAGDSVEEAGHGRYISLEGVLTTSDDELETESGASLDCLNATTTTIASGTKGWVFNDGTNDWFLNSAGGDGNVREARVTVAIPAAGSNLTADWGTTGKVKLTDPSTGILDDDETSVVNKSPVAYAIDCWVEVQNGKVINGTCDPVGFWSE